MATIASAVHRPPPHTNLQTGSVGSFAAFGSDAGDVLVLAPSGLVAAKGHFGAVQRVAVGADRFASAGVDGRVRIWSRSLEPLGEQIHSAPALHVLWAGDVLWSADGRGGVCADGRHVKAHDGAVSALVLDGSDVWSAGLDGRIVRHRDGAAWQLGSPVDSLAVRDGVILAGCADGSVVRIDRGQERRWSLGPAVCFVAHHGDSFIAATIDGRVQLDGRDVWTGAEGAFPVAIDPGGRHVWVGVAEGLRAWDLATLAPVAVLAPPSGHSSELMGITVGDRIVGWGRSLAIWARPDFAPTVEHIGRVRGELPWGADRLTFGNDGGISIRGPGGDRFWAAHEGVCWSVAVSPDGSRILTGGSRAVGLWDRDGKEHLRWNTPGTAVAWTPDGRMLCGGESVRLAILEGPTIRVLARAGSSFSDQTRAIEVDGGFAIARSTSGTGADRFDLGTGASTPIEVPPWSEPEFAGPPMLAATASESPADASPELPEAAGPPWLRAFLSAAKRWRCRPRAAIEQSMRDTSVPSLVASAWEAGCGSFTSDASVGFSEQAANSKPWNSPAGPLPPIARAWPSTFFAGPDGTLWEVVAGKGAPIGRVSDLIALLALRAAAGRPLLRVTFEGRQGASVAAATKAEPAIAGWWLTAGTLLSEGDDTVLALQSARPLPSALGGSVGAIRLEAPNRRVDYAPRASAPEAPSPPPASRPVPGGGFVAVLDPKKPIVQQIVTASGLVVEELVASGSTVRVVAHTLLSGEAPAPLSAPARSWLADNGARMDPRDRLDPEALAELLRMRGYAIHDAAFALEAEFGGLLVPDADEPLLKVGVASYLAAWPAGWQLDADARAQGLVPCGTLPSDHVLAVGPDGRIHIQGMVDMPRPEPIAADIGAFLERWIGERPSWRNRRKPRR